MSRPVLRFCAALLLRVAPATCLHVRQAGRATSSGALAERVSKQLLQAGEVSSAARAAPEATVHTLQSAPADSPGLFRRLLSVRNFDEGLVGLYSAYGAEKPFLEKRENYMIAAAVAAPVIWLSIWLTVVVGVALVYNSHKLSANVDIDRARESFNGEGFKHGPFSCFEDLEICCWSCWCGGIRWADSMNAVGIVGFWIGILTYIVICIVETCTGGVTVWVLVALFFTYYRQELRKKLHMRNDGETVFMDFLLWCCCSPCAITQEARQVKEAPVSEVPPIDNQRPVASPRQKKMEDGKLTPRQGAQPASDLEAMPAEVSPDKIASESARGSTGGAVTPRGGAAD